MAESQPVPGDGTGALETERIDARYRRLDVVPTLDALRAMNEAEAGVPAAVRAVLPQIARVVDAVAARMEAGGRLIYLGAGTSGRLGVVDASECPPTFHTDPDQVVGVIAGGRGAMFESVEGAEDSADLGAADIGRLGVAAVDTVVGIAASGRTPFVLGGIRAARAAGALTVGLACNTGSALGAAVDLPIEVEVGPEVIAGSTRLKAGSATKQVLNMISTGVMIRLGKTYGNLMVDLSVSNVKLRERAERLVATITGADPQAAARALTESGLRVPVAAIMLARGVDRDAAERLLAGAGGRLGGVLDAQA
ncbi:N-acetylmuramic acid 6-phosphate etherase [Occultella glacieicola]|uniref:N-acetylmuramic acid 6-phosphate etherase n=1 Tax=Occultella glacieicola TaxID=2518684 RepID=A0ABY2E1F0_9MICO|nr:N-acetylmuramic acid 6-phosphate etherase [Occultella glacieicola]TDE89197.1 N-acetylmuramic acid 6-phosphate etherase [Occultella glacieicola]